MRLFHGLRDDHELGEGFVSIGNFDGVHRGHAAIIKRLVARAGEAGLSAVVLTFDPHPIHLLRPGEAPPRLSTLADRAAWLGGLGVDALVAYPTTHEMLRLSPEEFFEQVIVGRLAARGLVEGPNFFFGRNRSGNIDTLAELCGQSGITLDIVDPLAVDGTPVSSSLIRGLVADGEVAGAAKLLGRPYCVCGVVTRGAGRGRSLGVPTANLEEIATLVPGGGVYVAEVRGTGASAGLAADPGCPAAAHVGGNPTFAEEALKVEVHLLDFDRDLYGQTLQVEFHERTRGTETFEDVEALQAQLHRDLADARAWFADRGGAG